MADASPAACCLLLSLFLLTYISSALGQASSPFKGQGVDPVTSGNYTAEDRVPVYVSIIFNKLVHVDGECRSVAAACRVPALVAGSMIMSLAVTRPVMVHAGVARTSIRGN